MLALTDTNIAEFASAREEFAVLVKRDGHDAIGGVESFLNTITMVNVDVNVENALIVAKKLKDSKYDVWARKSAMIVLSGHDTYR